MKNCKAESDYFKIIPFWSLLCVVYVRLQTLTVNVSYRVVMSSISSKCVVHKWVKMCMFRFMLSNTLLICNALEDNTCKHWPINTVIAVEPALFSTATTIRRKVVLSIAWKSNKTVKYLGWMFSSSPYLQTFGPSIWTWRILSNENSCLSRRWENA